MARPDECSPDEIHDGISRMWNSGWQRYVFPSVWLIYLAQTVSGVGKHSSGVAAVIGYAIVVAFAVCYLAALPMGWQQHLRTFYVVYAVCIVLLVVECFLAGPDALVFLVYIAVLTVAARRWWSPWMILALVLFGTFGEMIVPAWHTKEADWTTGLSVLLVAFAMYGFFQIIQSNRELAAARAEVARLAAENERSRIARDLHDLLGHSLTTITVKAGLARRLAERGEAVRAQQEITEVEQLSRRTLGDVRAAVAGHRDVTLAGELATAREVLRAAGITAEFPGSVDVVEPGLSEVFGWVVREGITNVVRHSHAPRCEIRIGPRWIEIADTGHGGVPGTGNGLAGLRERVGAYGGTVTTTSTHNGFVLRAEVPVPAPEAAAVPVDRAEVEA